MELNSLQIEEFDEKGFLFFSDLFESNEIDFLKLKYSVHQRCKFIFDKENIKVKWVAP